MSGKTVSQEVVSLSTVQEILSSDTSKSSKIRNLHALGYDRSTISHLLNIRYQHVRNVLLTQLTSK